MRGKLGTYSVELVGALSFLVPIVLYGLDYMTLLYSAMLNNNLCESAVRAAASGPPVGFAADRNDTPKARAAAVIAGGTKSNSIVQEKKTVRIAEGWDSQPPSPPFGGPFLGQVTLKTRCDVFPPFPLPMIDAHVVLYATQTHSWRWVMPTNYTSSAWPGIPQSPSDDLDLPIPDNAP